MVELSWELNKLNVKFHMFVKTGNVDELFISVYQTPKTAHFFKVLSMDEV